MGGNPQSRICPGVTGLNFPHPSAIAKPDALAEGQIRTFKIVKLDVESKEIEVELA